MNALGMELLSEARAARLIARLQPYVHGNSSSLIAKKQNKLTIVEENRVKEGGADE